MREKYLIGIVAENPKVPTPSAVIDYLDFDNKIGDTQVLVIRFCPWCGKHVHGGPLRVGI